jgi:ubiquinone/menaquinone biosynthesis C-methylase UbiE
MAETTTFRSLIQGLDHVQIVVPRAEEEKARVFYSQVLGLPEVPKPDVLQQRGGAWYRCGSQQLHLGLEDAAIPSSRAHPAFLVSDLETLRLRLEEAGMPIMEDVPVPDFRRFSTRDPFGNRLEFLERVGISPVKDQVRRMYSRAAQAYVTSPGHAAGDDLERLLALANPQPSDRALDISTGGGHTALAVAPYVASVTASDLTPRMLEAARDFITEKGQRNVSFLVADAERLPFLDASFDLVTVRIAPHHYPQVEVAVREMARVLTPGGRLIVIDNIAPQDALLDRYMNEWEKRRDPSHVRAWTQSEWEYFVTEAGLRIEAEETGRKQHDFASWAERMQMPGAERERLAADMLAAPQAVRDFFEVKEQDSRLVNWSADYLILRATK